MPDGLSLPLAQPFKVVKASHIVSDCWTSQKFSRSGTESLLFSIDGRLEIGMGGKSHALRPGEAFLMSSSPSAFSISAEAGADFYLLRFARNGIPSGFQMRKLEIPRHVVLLNPRRLQHVFLMLLDAASAKTDTGPMINHLVALMLCELARGSLVKAEARTDGLETMASRVDAYIAAHYHQPIGSPDVAREFRYNAEYLERAYRAERSVSIREAIHMRRIREARVLLLIQRKRRILEVAALCGYPNPARFRRAFKRAVGMTPFEFRSLKNMDPIAPGPEDAA